MLNHKTLSVRQTARLLPVALVHIIVLILAIAFTPSVEGQEPDTTPTPATGDAATSTGRLVVVPQTVAVGQTTLAVGFHVEPADVEVSIEYSEHLTTEGESCTGEFGTTTPAMAPTWVRLDACTVGTGIVRLVDASTGNAIKEVSVTVTKAVPPSERRSEATPTVSIGGLVSSLDAGETDEFTVSVRNLDQTLDYELYTVPLNFSLAFNRACDDRQELEDVEDTAFFSCPLHSARLSISGVRALGVPGT